nr:MAG TPA: hypothetical protein [Caudoviricetes sp.]
MIQLLGIHNWCVRTISSLAFRYYLVGNTHKKRIIRTEIFLLGIIYNYRY